MTLLKRFLSLLLFFLPFIAIGQYKEGTIAWSEDRRLTWKDYEAQPDPDSDAAAVWETRTGPTESLRSHRASDSLEYRAERDHRRG